LKEFELCMDKLQVTERNLGQGFNSRSGRTHCIHLHLYEAELANLVLKTRPIQLLGSLVFDIVLPKTLQKWALLLYSNLRLGQLLSVR
jgi:hypothetical protein